MNPPLPGIHVWAIHPEAKPSPQATVRIITADGFEFRGELDLDAIKRSRETLAHLASIFEVASTPPTKAGGQG